MLSHELASPPRKGNRVGTPDSPGLNLACGAFILLEDPSTSGKGMGEGIRYRQGLRGTFFPILQVKELKPLHSIGLSETGSGQALKWLKIKLAEKVSL